jgi:hypothetical protein
MEDQDLYTPAEAVKYLQESRGLILTVDGLKSRRRRNQAQAKHHLINNTLWTKTELDAIQPSGRTKLVPVKKNGVDGGEKTNHDAHGILVAA